MNIVETIGREKLVETIARNLKVPEPDIPDLAQEVYLDLLLKDQKTLEALYQRNELNYFVTKIVMNMYFSTTSRYYYKIKRYEKMRDASRNPDDSNDAENNNE